jgi:DNA-binding CsgD family transcriptional regulator
VNELDVLPRPRFAAIVDVVGEIVGRDYELGLIRAFLDGGNRAPRALVLEGEAGIGKSTLWHAAVEEAGVAARVLTSRPAEAERGLAFAGLGDLFEPVLDDVLADLPPPRRKALRVALLVEDATGGVDPRALGVAVRSALETLAAERPLVLAIDDEHWLDRSSASALAFALRRTGGPVSVVLARRAAAGTEPSSLEPALPSSRIERIRVGPLSVGAIQAVLVEQLGRVFARPTLVRIHETSGGNPFYAIELARALGPDVDPTLPLPVPETLEELVAARLAGLPSAAREGLVLASALGDPSLKLLHAAGIDDHALESARAAHVIEVTNGLVRFAHPLLSSVLYQGLSSAERRRAHTLLADVVDDRLERARHLALASEGPDADVVAALDEAVALALERGASATAAELAEHAVRLTPVGDRPAEHRRTIAAGRAHLAAGEVERARALARALDDVDPDGERRADALLFRSEIELGRLGERVVLRRRALEEPALTPELRQFLHQKLALETRFFEGREAAEAHARAAWELAESLGDDVVRAVSLSTLALLRFIGGEPDARALAEEALSLARKAPDDVRFVDCAFCLAHMRVWTGETEEARALLAELDGTWGERDERVSAQVSWFLAFVELYGGRLALAGGHAERAKELHGLYGRGEDEDPHNYLPVAVVAAFRGDLEVARDLAVSGSSLAETSEALLPGLAAVPGLAALWGSDAHEATACFDDADRIADAAGWVDPTIRWWRAEQVEALLELGRLDDADVLLDGWDVAASPRGRRRARAQIARCRGLLAAARGELEAAVGLLEDAARAHDEIGDPLGRARALLALGVVRRRVRQKRAAREAIADALAAFVECGAALFAEKARAELGRIGGRTREEGLTPAEQRVAALVAEGRTNREVAAALVLGERTVETHLTHIYAKLGIRSRTELARLYEPVAGSADIVGSLPEPR